MHLLCFSFIAFTFILPNDYDTQGKRYNSLLISQGEGGGGGGIGRDNT